MDGYSSYHNEGVMREQDFQKLTQTIATSIQKISQNVSSMQRMVNQIGTPQDSQELRSKLHSIQHYTQQLVKDTNTYIKDLNKMPPAASQSEQRQFKMQRERLADEFTSSLNMFQNAQRSAALKEKEQMNRTKEKAFGDPFLQGGNKRENLIELQDSTQSRQQQQLQEEIDLRALEEQERSIRQLENDISDVNQIFKELGQLVHDQGEIVDSIEASVEQTENYVSQATQQLRDASSYKNKIRKKKLYLAIIAAIILTVIIIIIATQVS